MENSSKFLNFVQSWRCHCYKVTYFDCVIKVLTFALGCIAAMVQQSPKGTPSRRTPTRGGGPKHCKQSWTKCSNCGLKTMSNHECETPGSCIGDGLVRLTPVFKDSAYCHLHPETMKEIGIKIGSFAKISSDVFECWPDPTVLLDHVGVSSQEKGIVTLSPIQSFRAAAKVTVSVEGKVDRSYLPFVLQNKVVFPGQKISIPYFSKKITLVIESVVPIAGQEVEKSDKSNGVDALTSQLSTVSIAEEYYQILPTTDFVDKQIHAPLPKIIGVERIGSDIQDILDQAFLSPSVFGSMGPPKTLLITGPSGSGKTLLCKTIMFGNEAWPSCTVHEFSKPIPCEDHIKIVLLDGLDSIGDDQSDKIGHVINFLKSLPRARFVLATATHLPPSLLKFFPFQLQMPAVTSDVRTEIFEACLSEIESEVSSDDITSVSFRANGYVGADICNVCRQALLLAGKDKLNMTHLLTALTKVPPRSMNDIKIEVPEVRWSDIGGLRDVQELLSRVISWPIIHQERYRKMGISAPRGVLMYGPPGCCKTMMAKALATESNLNFLSVKGPELLSMYVGESERAIRDLFSRARSAAPAIIFFDEIDALATHRGADRGSGVHDRVLAQLLTELDGVEGLTGVVVIAATNRPDRIDKALLRPGRLEKLVYIPLPDLQCREEIFKLKFQKIPYEGLDFVECAKLTEGLSGAEVVAVCHNAAIESITSGVVTSEIVQSAISNITPQTSSESLSLYDDFSKNKLAKF